MILHILDYAAETIRVQNVFSFGYVNSQTKQPNKDVDEYYFSILNVFL